MLQNLTFVSLLPLFLAAVSQVSAEKLTMENSSTQLKTALVSDDLQGDLRELDASPFLTVLFEAMKLDEMMRRFKETNLIDGKILACKEYPVHPGLRILFMASVHDEPKRDMNEFFDMALGQIHFHKIPAGLVRGVSIYGQFKGKKWYSWLPGVQGHESYAVIAIATDCQFLKKIQAANPNARISSKATSTLISLIIDNINGQQDPTAHANSRVELNKRILENFAHSPRSIDGILPDIYSLKQLDDLANGWFVQRNGLLDILRVPDFGISMRKSSRTCQPCAIAHEAASAAGRPADGTWTTFAFGYAVFENQLKLKIVFIPENPVDTDKYFLSSLKRSSGIGETHANPPPESVLGNPSSENRSPEVGEIGQMSNDGNQAQAQRNGNSEDIGEVRQRQQTETERLETEETERLRREEEARLKEEEHARLKPEDDATIKREEETRLKQEEEETRLKQEEEEARLKREEDARLKREEETRLKQEEEEAMLKREEEARLKREEETRLKQEEEEARLKRDEEARLKREDEARLKEAGQEMARKEEEDRLQNEEEERLKREREERLKKEREERLNIEQEVWEKERRKAESDKIKTSGQKPITEEKEGSQAEETGKKQSEEKCGDIGTTGVNQGRDTIRSSSDQPGPARPVNKPEIPKDLANTQPPLMTTPLKTISAPTLGKAWERLQAEKALKRAETEKDAAKERKREELNNIPQSVKLKSTSLENQLKSAQPQSSGTAENLRSTSSTGPTTGATTSVKDLIQRISAGHIDNNNYNNIT